MVNKKPSIATRRLLANNSVLPAFCSMRNTAFAVFLCKFAKHLALLACLLILGKAGDQLTIGPFAIFIIVLFASAAHLAGRSLSLRLTKRPSNISP